MRRNQNIFFLLIALGMMLGLGCVSYRQANDAAVEKLRQRLIDEDFNEIYKDTADVTRAQLSYEEFVLAIKSATDELKTVDPEVNWHRSSHSAYEAVFRDDNFSWMYLERDGRKINVQLTWAPDFKLCEMSTFNDINGSGKRVFRNCD